MHPLVPTGIEALEIDDAESFRHVALFADLKDVLARDHYRFLVPAEGEVLSWDRAVFLNLAFWDEAKGGDVLTEPRIDADVVMHAAWHHLAHRALESSVEAQLLGEAIASAFDLYLVGRLLGHAPESAFLRTQVPLIGDAAASAGVDEDAFEEMLGAVAADPDRAFEDLRSLLYQVSVELLSCEGAAQALAVLESHGKRRFAPLLHHYELASWIANARATRAASTSAPDPETGGSAGAKPMSARAVNAALEAAPSAIEWLEQNWVRPLASAAAHASVGKT